MASARCASTWVALLSLATSLAGCAGDGGRLSDSNLILIVVDSLRADHLGAYGYDKETSPFLDELARSGVLFETAISTAPQTVPSVVSLWSSTYPSRNGNNYFPRTNSVRAPESRVMPEIPDSLPLLAEILRARGYRTAAVVTNPWLSPRFGFGRGFRDYRWLAEGRSENRPPDGREVNDAARDILGELRGERFFLYLHYMDVHSPYVPRKDLRRRFVGDLKGRNVFRNGPAPAAREADVRFTTALYDAEIRGLDDTIRELFALLEASDPERDTLVVFTSDHGEEFHDHGGMGHGWTVYEEMARVPLFFVHPKLRARPRRIPAPVSGVDLLPTLLELLGAPAPAALDGISLAPWILGRQDPDSLPPRVLLRELGDAKAASRGSHKVVWSRRDEHRVEVYDLAEDPGEARPLADPPEWAAELEAALARLAFGAAEGEAPEAEEDSAETRRMRRQLRALGYVDPTGEETGTGTPPSEAGNR